MSIILFGIIACEIAFWVILGLGLAARYLLRMRRLSTALLLSVPLVDVVLLALITWDLVVNRATADFAHGLGAVYLGFTVAFGHQTIARVDAWFAHRFAGGPVPPKPPKSGPGYVRYEWQQWARVALLATVASVIIGVIVLIVGDQSLTAELADWIGRVWAVTGIWLVAGPIWATLNPKGSAAADPSADPAR